MSNDFKVNNCTHPQHLSMISDNLDEIIGMYNTDGDVQYTMNRTRYDGKKFRIKVYIDDNTHTLTFECIY